MSEKKRMYNPNKNWSIEKGDYKRDEEATWSYHKKQKRKSLIKTIFWIIFYALSVSGVTYVALSLI